MEPEVLPTASGPLRIVFEDTHLIVLVKPAGLLSQGESTGDENLVDVLRTYFGRNYVGLIHRLDRNVSGLMVAGKRSKSADRLSEALRGGTLVRRYVARVAGTPPGRFTLENHLRKDPRTNETKVVPAGTKDAKAALLNGRTLRMDGETSDVELTLETGRSHQIRVQLAAAGHPIRNDLKYRGAPGARADTAIAEALFLHSAYLAFPHPMSKVSMEFRDEPRW